MLIGDYKLNLSDDSRQEYVYLNSTPIAVMRARDMGRVYADHLDTPRRVATNDEDAQIVWKWESKPFGETEASGEITFNLRFPGQYFDTELKTHYNINRDYNPVTGRYIQSDPVGFDGGLNTYLYADGNSIQYFDSKGLRTEFKGVVATVASIMGGYSYSYGTFTDEENGRKLRGSFTSSGPAWGADVGAGAFEGEIFIENSYESFKGWANVFSWGFLWLNGANIYRQGGSWTKIGKMWGGGVSPSGLRFGANASASYTEVYNVVRLR